MERRKRNLLVVLIGIVIVVAMVSSFGLGLFAPDTAKHRAAHAGGLPAAGGEPGEQSGLVLVDGDAGDGADRIETLTRPRQYSRVIRVEQLWDGGSGSFETTVTVSGRWTRTDRSLSDGQVRHTITDGEITYIWYGSESSVYSACGGHHPG